MGPLSQVMGMLPGMNKVPQDAIPDDKALVKIEAMIQSMTIEERQKPQVINGSRRKRIAMGSGSTVQDLNKLMKQFEQMQKMMKSMGKGVGMNKLMRGRRMPAGF